MTTHHGGDLFATATRLGCEPEELLDMSSNLSPLGPPSELLQYLRDRIHEIGHLPEADNASLRAAFAALYGITSDQVLAGNGTTEFIFALPAVLRPDRAVVITPTYSDYALACQWAGVPLSFFSLPADLDFQLDLDRLADHLQAGDLVFLCNPNNPTGRLLSSTTLLQWISRRPQCRFVVDESYIPFCHEPSLLELQRPDNLFILSSFSKIYGIPGLRLGFLTAPVRALGALHSSRKPWGVNRLAQLAGRWLCEHGEDRRRRVLAFLEQHRQPFTAALDALPGVSVVPGVTNFILCRLSGEMDATTLYQRLLTQKIIIRDCHNFIGLDQRYFRLSLQTRIANQRCITALQQLLTDPRQ